MVSILLELSGHFKNENHIQFNEKLGLATFTQLRSLHTPGTKRACYACHVVPFAYGRLLMMKFESVSKLLTTNQPPTRIWLFGDVWQINYNTSTGPGHIVTVTVCE